MDLTNVLLWVLPTAITAWIIKWLIWRVSRRLAPGPICLPVVGYLPFLSSIPYEDYKQLGKKYGNIIGLYLGSQYAVILNDFADIKEAFNKEEFLDRPPHWFRLTEDSDNVLDMNGWAWRETRRFTLTALRNLGMGKNKIEEAIQEELSVFIEKIEKAGPKAEINVFEASYVHFLNIILTMTCGRPYQDGDRLLDIMNVYGTDFLNRMVENQRKVLYPFTKPLYWLRNLIPATRKPALEDMKKFIRTEIDKHERNMDENNLDDYVSYYLNEINKNMGKDSSIKHENLLGNTEILLFAATDTTRMTISWTMLFLAKHQDHQEKVYQQIVEVVGKERQPEWSDKDDLPLLNAFIMETARYKTIANADDPHWSTSEGEIGGYCIPQGTIILANVAAVHSDPKLWGDPENFRPWRFINAEGKAVAPEYWIPFLTGKRMCPGVKLALMQLFLMLTRILQKFKVVPAKSGLSTEDRFHLLRYPAKPIVSFQVRD